MRLAWSRSHGEPMETLTFPVHSADPPSNGGVDNSADATATSAGAPGGFSLERRNAWDVIAGQGDALSDLRDFLETTEENPALRAAATLRAMDRLRDALLLIEETASVETPVPLMLQDVALLGRQLLQRLC